MVIQCEKCDTRFRLPDDRLKPEGVKVRCSHCKEVFTVYPPSDEAPVETSAPAPAPTPAPPAESGGGDDLDFDSAFSEDASFDDSAAGDDFAGGDDFSAGDDFDLPEGDNEGAAGESDDFGFDFSDNEDQEAGQSPNEFAFDEGNWDEESAGGEAAAVEAGPSEFSFDDSTWEEDKAEAPAEAGDSAPEGGGEIGAGTNDEFSFDEEDWSDSPAPSGGGDDGLGGFDSDFGIEDNSALDVPDSAPGPSGEGGDFKFTELSSPSSGMDDSGFSEGFADDAGFGFDDNDLASSVPEPPVKRQKKSSSSMLPFLLVIMLLLAGAAGFFLWQQGQLPFVDELISQIKGATTVPETSRIEVKGLDHDFVENSEVGSLFLIRGQAINRFAEKRSSLQVRGQLFDGNGRSLASQVVYCGNPLSNEELTSMSYAQIAEAMGNQFGEALSNFEVPPGKGLPFVIVFRDVPENLVEYGVDVVGSQAVAK